MTSMARVILVSFPLWNVRNIGKALYYYRHHLTVIACLILEDLIYLGEPIFGDWS